MKNEVIVANATVNDMQPILFGGGDGIVLAFNGLQAENIVEAVAAIGTYIRAKVLKSFGITEAFGEKVVIGSGVTFNTIKSALKLPPVLTDENGIFQESLPQYWVRVSGKVNTWLANAVHNANVRREAMERVRVDLPA